MKSKNFCFIAATFFLFGCADSQTTTPQVTTTNGIEANEKPFQAGLNSGKYKAEISASKLVVIGPNGQKYPLDSLDDDFDTARIIESKNYLYVILDRAMAWVYVFDKSNNNVIGIPDGIEGSWNGQFALINDTLIGLVRMPDRKKGEMNVHLTTLTGSSVESHPTEWPELEVKNIDSKSIEYTGVEPGVIWISRRIPEFQSGKWNLFPEKKG